MAETSDFLGSSEGRIFAGGGMRGVYQHCSKKHLHRYLAEFDLRYSNRAALGCEDQERAMRAVIGGVGKRLMYQTAGVGA